jgi:outer membrane lipoprotein SlyB
MTGDKMKKVLLAVAVIVLLQGCANYDYSFNKHYTSQHNA